MATVVAGLVALFGIYFSLRGLLREFRNDLSQRIDSVQTNLERQIDGLRVDLGSTKLELGQRIHGVHTELVSTKAELGQRIDRVRTELGTTKAELSHGIDRARTGLVDRIDSVESHVVMIHERLTSLEQRTYDITRALPASPSTQLAS